MEVEHPGKIRKFVKRLSRSLQWSVCLAKWSEVLYLTERGLFRLTSEGIELIEIAPGIDLEKDILNMMEFKPIIKEPVQTMSLDIFKEGSLNLNHSHR